MTAIVTKFNQGMELSRGQGIKVIGKLKIVNSRPVFEIQSTDKIKILEGVVLPNEKLSVITRAPKMFCESSKVSS